MANTASEQKVSATTTTTPRGSARPYITTAIIEGRASRDAIASSVTSQSGSDSDDDDGLPSVAEINQRIDNEITSQPRSQSLEPGATTIPNTPNTGSSLRLEEGSNELNRDGINAAKAFYIQDSGNDTDSDDVCGRSSDGDDDGHHDSGNGKRHRRRSRSVTSSASERGNTAKRQKVARDKQV